MKRHLRAAARHTGRHGHYLAFTIALLALAGSLFYSGVLHFAPCDLCWYGRILMYPLVAIVAVGILRRDHGWVFYAAPLTIAGTTLALYHSLLQWGLIPEAIRPCVAGVPCTTKYINYLGFITIPFLELLAFTAINVCLYLYWKENTRVPRS
jgi:disulfide bond formation protein DsbB